jgi:hypothetical protein
MFSQFFAFAHKPEQFQSEIALNGGHIDRESIMPAMIKVRWRFH